MQTEAKTYNGWTNYETWCVNLWLTNEQGSAEFLTETATRPADLSERAQSLKEWVTDADDDFPSSGLFQDLLQAALDNVDWREIVENHEHDDEE